MAVLGSLATAVSESLNLHFSAGKLTLFCILSEVKGLGKWIYIIILDDRIQIICSSNFIYSSFYTFNSFCVIIRRY